MPDAFEITEIEQINAGGSKQALGELSARLMALPPLPTVEEVNQHVLRKTFAQLISQRSDLKEQLDDDKKKTYHAQRELYLKFLSVADSLDRLISFIDPSNDIANSLKVLRAEFLQHLQEQDVLPIELMPGQPFDLDTCEVSSRQERNDLPHGTIISIDQRGYTWKSRTLRRARVVISTEPKGA